MSRIDDVLENYYNSFINQPDDYGFFYGLAGYLNYILETPSLEKIINVVMKKKQNEYDKLAKLEDKSLQELTQVKNKILKIIKDNVISPNSLTSHYFTIKTSETGNLLTDLERLEKGDGFSMSGFMSDNYAVYLSDIVANLLGLGHKELIKDFFVSDEIYKNYHFKPDRKFVIVSNENGNFIFSKTLKLRREQSSFIEKTEKFELWGVLNKLLKFQQAFSEKTKNSDFSHISQKYCGDGRNWQESRDAVDIIFLAQELEVIVSRDKNQIHNSIRKLKRDDFKTYAMTINAYIIKELAKREVIETQRYRQLDRFQKQINDTDDWISDTKRQIHTKAILNNSHTAKNKITQPLEKRLITRDEATGDFYYKDKLVKFNAKNAVYYLIFECLFEKGDYEGFCSYKDMDGYLVKNGKEEYEENRKIKDRIKNGLMSLLRFSSLPKKIPNGKDLITIARGKGLILNNPIIK